MTDESDRSEDGPLRALLFLSPSDVPERWKGRARPMALVPLLPEEAAQLLREGSATPGLPPEDEPLVTLLARGRSVERISKELHLTERSVYRRVARLREKFGVQTTAELTTLLSRLGF